jgi:hypothetical protein
MDPSRPFFCNMGALSADERVRHQTLGEFLRAALLGVRDLPYGYQFEFTFKPQIFNALAEITPLEHACCSFFSIAIRLVEDGKLLWELTGPPGVREFIRLEFDKWFKE